MVDAQPRVGALQAATTAELVAEKVSDATASPESVNRYLEQFQCFALALGVFFALARNWKRIPSANYNHEYQLHHSHLHPASSRNFRMKQPN